MNNRIARSKSTLFLIELILAIGIFALASAVCIRLFAGAHLLSRQNETKTHALYAATSAAEAFKATGGDTAQMAGLLSAQSAGGRLTVHYSAQWEIVPEPVAGGFTMRIDLDLKARPAEAAIRIADDHGQTVYTLLAKKHIGGEVRA